MRRRLSLWLAAVSAALAAGLMPAARSAAQEMGPAGMPTAELLDIRDSYKSDSQEHAGIAAQGFVLRNDAYPHLFARTSFCNTMTKGTFSGRMYHKYLRAIDCGSFGAGKGAAAGWLVEDASSIHAEISYGPGVKTIISRAVPAFLLDTSESEVFLLRPTNYSLPGSQTSPSSIVPEIRPGWLALPCEGGVRVYTCGAPLQAEALPEVTPPMTEPWLLVWGGESSSLRILLPNQDTDNWRTKHLYSYDGDMPWLFVLQHQPFEILANPAEGVMLNFEDQEAGKIVGMPLRGSRFFAAGETEQWKRGLPEEVAAQCRMWTRYLRYYPIGAHEELSVKPNGNVSAAVSFTYEHIEDDWDTQGIKAAFIPPMAGMLSLCSKAVAISPPARETGVTTFDGEILCVESESCEIEFRVGPFFAAASPYSLPEAAGHEAAAVRERLAREIDWVLDRGHLAPFFPFTAKLHLNEWLHTYPCWRRPEAAIRALMRAWPHLDPERQGRVRAYLQTEFQKFPPAETGGLPIDEGTRRELYPCGPDTWGEEYYAEWMNRVDAFDYVPPETWYALWLHASLTEDWSYIEENWERILADARALAEYADWPSSGLKTWPGLTLEGGAGDINAAASGFLGVSRMAQARGEAALADEFAGIAAKLFACRLGMQEYYRFMMERLAPPSIKNGTYKDEDVVAAARPDARPRIVHALDGFGPRLWNAPTPFQQSGLDVTYMGLWPELARFLAEYGKAYQDRYAAWIDRAYLLWHRTKAPIMNVRMEESSFVAPQVAWGAFLFQAMVRGASAAELAARLDIPWCPGDWFYIEKLALCLDAFAREGSQ